MDFALKIFGWALLVVGVVIIIWTLYSTYNIFTGKVAMPEIFKMPVEEKTPLTKEGAQSLEAQLEEKMKEAISEQLKGFLPVDALPKMLNLIVWSMLAFILIFGGSQLSSLGIKLIKK